MSGYNYPVKDRKIRIFFEQEQGAGTVKHYIHPQNMKINAYVRQLSANEQNSANAIQDTSDILFVINASQNRTIKVDMYIEFKSKTYQIDSVDNFEFKGLEVKIIAHEVSEKEYVETIWR